MKTKRQRANEQPGDCLLSGTPRKQRPDAVLKNLPKKRQDEVAEFGRTHTLVKTVAWLEEGGVTITVGPLSTFLAEYRVNHQLERNAAVVQVLLLQELKRDPRLTPEAMQRIGQSFFSGLAIEQEDARVWDITQQIELKKGKLQLEGQKHRDEVKDRRAKIKRERKAGKKGDGISAETLEQIERELKLM